MGISLRTAHISQALIIKEKKTLLSCYRKHFKTVSKLCKCKREGRLISKVLHRGQSWFFPGSSGVWTGRNKVFYLTDLCKCKGGFVMVHLCGPCACVWLDFWTFFLRFVCVQLQLLLPRLSSPPPSDVTWFHISGRRSRMYRLDCEVFSCCHSHKLKKKHLSG